MYRPMSKHLIQKPVQLYNCTHDASSSLHSRDQVGVIDSVDLVGFVVSLTRVTIPADSC